MSETFEIENFLCLDFLRSLKPLMTAEVGE